jgi:outer membrane protein OmpA-like peptidoglycan-associated protein
MKYVVVICLLLAGCAKPSPTVSLSAAPPSVEHGKCATLTWSSANASAISIDQELGTVDPSGSKEVCPLSSTIYTITAAGDGGSVTATTTISVSPLAAANLMIFPEAALFEFGKAELKPEGQAKINEYREQAKEQLSHAEHVIITGYTDNVGGSDHNSMLSQQRAEAVRDYLISLGADAQKFQVHGAGEAQPVADNSTD